MRKKPSFEQVSLEVVKRIVEEQAKHQQTQSGREITKPEKIEMLESKSLQEPKGTPDE
jgi:hypothetical protein